MYAADRQLRDVGVGVDDILPGLLTSGGGTAFTLTQTDITGTRILVVNTDYTYAYNANTNEAIFTSLTVFPSETRYNITLNRSLIRDVADNLLQPNRLDGSVQFNILVTDGDNDAPVNVLPATPTTNEDTAIILSGANAIQITDPDAKPKEVAKDRQKAEGRVRECGLMGT